MGTIILAFEQGAAALRLTKHAGGYIALTYGERLVGRYEHAELAHALADFHTRASALKGAA